MTEQTNAELIAAHQFDSGNCACGLPRHECTYIPTIVARWLREKARQRREEQS